METVKRILVNGVPPNAKLDVMENAPLHAAMPRGDVKTLRILLQAKVGCWCWNACTSAFVIRHFAFRVSHFAFCILHFAFCILHFAFRILHFAFASTLVLALMESCVPVFCIQSEA